MSPLYRKIALRLVPFLMLLYMVAFLDRVNISFAALTMNRDLGISDTLYGFAAGIFFLGYCLFEVPANLMLLRIGARRWIAILLIAWGATSVATAFVTNRPEYVAARFLLGVAESGFFPGVILYLTLWLPRPIRARIMALFLLAVPLCSCVGSPISSHILLMNHLSGLQGWQWLFILEGAPAIILGTISWFVLADSPLSARWLSAGEETQLARELHADEEIQRPDTGSAWLQVARDSIVYFMYSVGLYGLSFWLPKVLRGNRCYHDSDWMVGRPGVWRRGRQHGVRQSFTRQRLAERNANNGRSRFCVRGLFPRIGRSTDRLLVRFRRNVWRIALILELCNRPHDRQSSRSSNRHHQLRRRHRRFHRSRRNGLAPRRDSHVFRRPVVHRHLL